MNSKDPSNNKSSYPYKTNQNDTSQQLGRNMLIIAWVLGLLILTWFFGMWEENQINPNSSPNTHYSGTVTEVKLKRNRYGHYLTNGKINHQAVTFLVDTGATQVAIPGELHTKLGLELGQVSFTHTANGTAKTYDTTLKQLSIGGIQINNVRASIVPGMEGNQVLLGMSVLNQLEFTQRDNELTLRQIH